MLTSCPFCTTDTAGNHEAICPYYCPTEFTQTECISPNIFVKTSISIDPGVYIRLLEFLKTIITEGCDCNPRDHTVEYMCASCTANDLLEQLKGT